MSFYDDDEDVAEAIENPQGAFSSVYHPTSTPQTVEELMGIGLSEQKPRLSKKITLNDNKYDIFLLRDRKITGEYNIKQITTTTDYKYKITPTDDLSKDNLKKLLESSPINYPLLITGPNIDVPGLFLKLVANPDAKIESYAIYLSLNPAGGGKSITRLSRKRGSRRRVYKKRLSMNRRRRGTRSGTRRGTR